MAQCLCPKHFSYLSLPVRNLTVSTLPEPLNLVPKVKIHGGWGQFHFRKLSLSLFGASSALSIFVLEYGPTQPWLSIFHFLKLSEKGILIENCSDQIGPWVLPWLYIDVGDASPLLAAPFLGQVLGCIRKLSKHELAKKKSSLFSASSSFLSSYPDFS